MAKYKVYFTFSTDIEYPKEVGKEGQEISDMVTEDIYADMAISAVDSIIKLLTDKLHVIAIERDRDE